MPDLAKKVVYGEGCVQICGPKGGCDLDLKLLDRMTAGQAQAQCGLVARATGVGLWEVMKYWAEGASRRQRSVATSLLPTLEAEEGADPQ